MTDFIDIGQSGRRIGLGEPVFVIAEAGVNHNGDTETARQLIAAAADAGADAVKFQTFNVDRLLTRDAPKAEYQIGQTGAGQSQYDMLAALQLDESAHRVLQTHCEARGIIFLSSPFDEQSMDFLVGLDVPALKIPSGELTNLSYLAHAAQCGLPLIVSTGMATLAEVEDAVAIIRGAGNEQFVLLHCLSDYPADPSEINLRAMATMAAAFQAPIGYSDHSLGDCVTLAAVALGACVIEKHFTLDRTMPGPDHQASLEPDQLAVMIAGIRAVELALGDGVKRPQTSELSTAAVARKSLVAACDIAAGVTLDKNMVAIMRPGTGLAPGRLADVLGRRARKPLVKGALLVLDDLENPN